MRPSHSMSGAVRHLVLLRWGDRLHCPGWWCARICLRLGHLVGKGDWGAFCNLVRTPLFSQTNCTSLEQKVIGKSLVLHQPLFFRSLTLTPKYEYSSSDRCVNETHITRLGLPVDRCTDLCTSPHAYTLFALIAKKGRAGRVFSVNR